MKKIIILTLMLFTYSSYSQEMINEYTKDFELGNGVNFSSNDNYFFKLSGMIQPSFSLEVSDKEFYYEDHVDYFFNSKRTFFSFSGYAKQENVSFLVLTDFSLTTPLLDAWVAYSFTNSLKMTFGQKLTKSNNREMLLMEDMLQFADRSILSTEFSQTGREFGVFLDYKYKLHDFGFISSLSLTSGDGRSSFGSDSRDVDLGGFKYGGRIDFYPLGFFKEGNENKVSDVMFENDLKCVIGFAGSFNDGASNSVGEGHGDFYLWNLVRSPQLPDYRQVYADILFKLKGASLLAEYVMTSASSLNQIYIDPLSISLMAPGEISNYLSLGNGLNTSLGYVFENGYSIDLRYSKVNPEYELNTSSVVQENSVISIAFAKYFVKDNFKLMTSFSQFNKGDNAYITTPKLMAELILQLKI
jgi:hypothetical protein|tara:strand:- start:986 stop:2227 length:1242 start_codon:yes stop_codon:yes gene_type:complete